MKRWAVFSATAAAAIGLAAACGGSAGPSEPEELQAVESLPPEEAPAPEGNLQAGGGEDLSFVVEELSSAIDDLSLRLDDIESSVEDVEARLEDVEAGTFGAGNLGSELNDLSSRIDDVESRVSDVEGEVGSSFGFDLSSRVDDLESTLSDICFELDLFC